MLKQHIVQLSFTLAFISNLRRKRLGKLVIFPMDRGRERLSTLTIQRSTNGASDRRYLYQRMYVFPLSTGSRFELNYMKGSDHQTPEFEFLGMLLVPRQMHRSVVYLEHQ